MPPKEVIERMNAVFTELTKWVSVYTCCYDGALQHLKGGKIWWRCTPIADWHKSIEEDFCAQLAQLEQPYIDAEINNALMRAKNLMLIRQRQRTTLSRVTGIGGIPVDVCKLLIAMINACECT
jgi:hypothetical protein